MENTKKNPEAIPLAWAGSTEAMDYLNFGDALSPVMVALLTGAAIERVSTRSAATRLAAVGTIGHGFAKGQTWFWGTGCSIWRNPFSPTEEREPFTVPEDSEFIVTATRGPLSERLLAGLNGARPGVYGDPVWLLPRFYRPHVQKRWKLGVILHLSELADRSNEAHPKAGMKRFGIPEDMADDVHLITTCTPIDVAALGAKIDEILACERIVSTSLHGMVIAESYGIPCLYFSPLGAQPGPALRSLDVERGVDPRIVDLYTGMGFQDLMTYAQPRAEVTDWADVIAAVDRFWQPKSIDEEALMNALPLPLDPVVAEPGKTIWQHPAITSIPLQHIVANVRKADAAVTARQVRLGVPFERHSTASGKIEKRERLARFVSSHAGVPLSWVASSAEMPFANLGDALSAVIVAGLSGLPVRHAHFDAPTERIVGVGTIGHAQKNGRLHFWGTGMDAKRNPIDRGAPYAAPPGTSFEVHATRGPLTANTLREAGIWVGSVAYGDPVSLLPDIWPMNDVEKTYDLGVVVHITELEHQHPASPTRPEFRRYEIPEGLSGRIRIINTICEPTLEALRAKVAEIVSCRAILSTSLHGLVLADAYQIPSAWFRPAGTEGGETLPLVGSRHPIDHRMRDYYLGAGAQSIATYSQDRAMATDWQAALDFVQARPVPPRGDTERLAASFPLELAPRDANGLWPLGEAVSAAFEF